MRRWAGQAAAAVAITLALFGISFQVGAQTRSATARVNDRQAEQIIRSIESRSDTFRRSFDAALDRSVLDGTHTEDSVDEFVKAFENATNDLRSRFDRRETVASDVENVLSSATVIDQFMRTNLRQRQVQADWARLAADLKRLAAAYNVKLNFKGSIFMVSSAVAVQRAYRVRDSQVDAVLRRIETKTDAFRNGLDRALDRRGWNDDKKDEINRLVMDFENSTAALRSKFDRRTVAVMDVSRVLVRSARIDDFMKRNLRLESIARRGWRSVRNDLNHLATYYNLGFNLDNRRGMPLNSPESHQLRTDNQ